MSNNDTRCLFCGGDTSFMCTIKDKVCLSCGDKLQALGVYLITKQQFEQFKLLREFGGPGQRTRQYIEQFNVEWAAEEAEALTKEKQK